MVYSVPDLKRIPFIEAIQQEFRPTRLGEWFGPSWVRERENDRRIVWILSPLFIVYPLVSYSDLYTRGIYRRRGAIDMEFRQ